MPRPIRVLTIALLTLVTSCKSAQVRNRELVAYRTMQLNHPKWAPTWCRVEARLTAPATSRYRQIFPQDVERTAEKSLPYTWKAAPRSCEVVSLDRSPLAVNFQSVLDVALCTLVQTHLVNSPFDELEPVAVESRGKKTFLQTGEEKDLGLLIDPKRVAIETRTKSRGTLEVKYEHGPSGWLPERLTQTMNKTIIDVNQIEYDGRQPKTFVLNVGEEHARPFANVDFSECRTY